jgi:hypothetical protein
VVLELVMMSPVAPTGFSFWPASVNVRKRDFAVESMNATAPAQPGIGDDARDVSDEQSFPEAQIIESRTSPFPLPQVDEVLAEPMDQLGNEQSEQVTSIEEASDVITDRYEVQESVEGWFVHDRETGDVAEVYGYRLGKLSRGRAQSLVEVLNRGEARRRGRNG